MEIGVNNLEVPLKYFFDYAARQIKTADSVPALLAAAFMGMELIERATTVLAQTAPENAYQTALAEASDAWWALVDAPTLTWPDRSMSDTDVSDLAESIAALVMVVAEAILNVASKTTDPADRVACLRAAHHAGNVHAAMK
ncbi:hypothetical protein [Actinomadura mexicana]|uniref:Uncharacterized protein n=1 Tax=Actinomadura mexicana TaxID=134959 RepID=A0A239H4E4_9ACTN|nr:hypothetical protein [Actinomadura mexicana]SNS76025.1 hypothetical protein SAMN06265355_12833 [Actinomadura mexicana]